VPLRSGCTHWPKDFRIASRYWGHWSLNKTCKDWTELREGLDDALEAWRVSPLAQRIVSLTTGYVVGSGIFHNSSILWMQKFVDEFWRLNGMRRRRWQWWDTLSLARWAVCWAG
jgi:hypothetical protein